MNKEYLLIKHIKTIGHKNPVQIIDSTNATNLKSAKTEFKKRNDFEKILRRADLVIAEVKAFIQ